MRCREFPSHVPRSLSYVRNDWRRCCVGKSRLLAMTAVSVIATPVRAEAIS